MKFTPLLILLLLQCSKLYAQDVIRDTVELNTDNAYTPEQTANFTRDSMQLYTEFLAMSKADQRFRKHWSGTSRPYWNEQFTIDSTNTLRLIEITKKYGFPSSYRFKGPKPSSHMQEYTAVSPHLIFMHAPPNLFKTLDKLIDTEYHAGHVSVFEYTTMMWHFNGRQPGFRIDKKAIE